MKTVKILERTYRDPGKVDYVFQIGNSLVMKKMQGGSEIMAISSFTTAIAIANDMS